MYSLLFACAAPAGAEPEEPLAIPIPEGMGTGPKGGYLLGYQYLGMNVEATIDPTGIIRVFAYDGDWEPVDLVRYYKRPLRSIEVRYLPDNSFIVRLWPDSDRGCLMAKIDMPRALKIRRAPNVVLFLI
jgi:hypothetical protein